MEARLVFSEEHMKNWKIGSLVVASAALLIGAGASSSRAALWTSPADVVQVQVLQPTAVAVTDRQAPADAEADNGPGCAESSLSR